MTDPASLRRDSEAAITRVGARVNPDLPPIDTAALALREGDEVARRALAINALVRAAFGWSRPETLRWLRKYGLDAALQPDELAFLDKPGQPSDADRWLCLHVETLAMAAWLGGLAREPLWPWDPMPDTTAALFPDPHQGQSPAPFLQAFRLRSAAEIQRMLDVHYRAHWHAAQCAADGTPNEVIPLAAVQFRRLLLEWTTHAGVDWHDVDLAT